MFTLYINSSLNEFLNQFFNIYDIKNRSTYQSSYEFSNEFEMSYIHNKLNKDSRLASYTDIIEINTKNTEMETVSIHYIQKHLQVNMKLFSNTNNYLYLI